MKARTGNRSAAARSLPPLHIKIRIVLQRCPYSADAENTSEKVGIENSLKLNNVRIEAAVMSDL